MTGPAALSVPSSWKQVGRMIQLCCYNVLYFMNVKVNRISSQSDLWILDHKVGRQKPPHHSQTLHLIVALQTFKLFTLGAHECGK